MYGAGNAAFLALTLANVLLLMVILPDTSRMVMTFIPFIYFFIKGSEFVIIRSKALFAVIVAVVAIGAMSFAKDYFTDYNRWATSIYMPGYGEAISRAYEIAGDEKEIISTYDGLSSPFMLSLYYTNYDPRKFYTTVEYKDPYAEFRVAKSFGNFTFGLPEDFSLSMKDIRAEYMCSPMPRQQRPTAVLLPLNNMQDIALYIEESHEDTKKVPGNLNDS